MPVELRCACGERYSLRDEFAGSEVKCPKCGAVARAPASSRSAQADPAFDRDKFLLRQKVLAINEKYDVRDEEDRSILFVQRPALLLRGLLAGFAAAIVVIAGLIVTGILAAALSGWAGEGMGPLASVVLVAGLLLTIVAAFLAGALLAPKRHVTFYRDESMREVLLRVQQDRKIQILHVDFTVQTAEGAVLARIRKNRLYDILRKRWACTAADGRPIFLAKEDSMILSLLRRLLGPLFGLLRTNFVYYEGDGSGEALLGEFNRKFTLFDRYVLDLTPDPQRRLDRRLAVAMGVMLDTGERR